MRELGISWNVLDSNLRLLKFLSLQKIFSKRFSLKRFFLNFEDLVVEDSVVHQSAEPRKFVFIRFFFIILVCYVWMVYFEFISQTYTVTSPNIVKTGILLKSHVRECCN